MRSKVWTGGTTRAAIGALVVCIAAAGCSSSSGGSSSATGEVDKAGLAAATAYLKTVTHAPKDIGLTVPLSKKPAPGKTIVAIGNGAPTNTEITNGIVEGAEALGWKVKVVNTDGTPEGDQKAMSAAIQLKPDGISVSSLERSVIGRQLKEAEAAGIPVSANATTDQPGPDLFDASIADVHQLDDWGKMVAAYVVSKSGGKANIAVFSLPAIGILQRFVTSFMANVKQWCPSCRLKEVPQQFGDLGTKTPGSVVSTLQRSPNTNWAVFGVGDMTLGVESALKAAGLSGKVRIVGLGGSAKNVASVKAGTEDAWTAYPFRAIGFRVIDIFARKFNGDDLVAAQKAPVPTQLITPDDVDALPLNASGFYIGVPDYADEFKALWKAN